MRSKLRLALREDRRSSTLSDGDAVLTYRIADANSDARIARRQSDRQVSPTIQTFARPSTLPNCRRSFRRDIGALRVRIARAIVIEIADGLVEGEVGRPAVKEG